VWAAVQEREGAPSESGCAHAHRRAADAVRARFMCLHLSFIFVNVAHPTDLSSLFRDDEHVHDYPT